MKKICYFDVDGTVRDYDGVAFAALDNGALEDVLLKHGFDRWVCACGKAALPHGEAINETALKERLWTELRSIFPNKELFVERVSLVGDPDCRCDAIDFGADWYYLDDWADLFFPKAHGQESYDRYIGTRILRVDPFGDGADVLSFLNQRANVPA